MQNLIIGIETSCDDTCIGIIELESGKIISNEKTSQNAIHSNTQGIIPNVASKLHLENIDLLLKKIATEQKIDLSCIRSIGVTYGPGLIGSLLIGINFAHGFYSYLMNQYGNQNGYSLNLHGVDHLEGHILINSLYTEMQYPNLSLVVSGGHTLLVLCERLGTYTVLGTTYDDAIGECLDKCARVMGLDYPGGMYVEKEAQKCVNKIQLPIPLIRHKNTMNFSFSGLKTSLVQEFHKNKYTVPDLCYALQHSAFTSIVKSIQQAYVLFPQVKCLYVSGGVAASQTLRQYVDKIGIQTFYPPNYLCTDNGLMPCSIVREYILNGTKPYIFPPYTTLNTNLFNMYGN